MYPDPEPPVQVGKALSGSGAWGRCWEGVLEVGRSFWGCGEWGRGGTGLGGVGRIGLCLSN